MKFIQNKGFLLHFLNKTPLYFCQKIGKIVKFLLFYLILVKK